MKTKDNPMREELTLEDLAVMAESVDLECKAAQGRDGRGELSQDVWKSYCAMANTDGGTIFLGVQEKPAGIFKAVGISNVERVRKAIWDSLHNRQVVNLNLLSESNVHPVEVDGNTLIHADYSGWVSVLIVKRPDTFGFRNPGRMRIPPEIAILGSNSDCRNRRLQTLFQLVGYGDHAGSGLPKIYRNWQGQHWRRPLLCGQTDPEQTLIELRMTSLIPAEALTELESHLGVDFRQLPELGRLALVTAVSEGMVNHARLREISTDHPADITKMLGRLVKEDFLVPDGVGRGMVYFAPWMPRPVNRETFSSELTISSGVRPPVFDIKRQELDPKRQELDPKRQESGLPIWTDRDQIPADEWASLQVIAMPVKELGKASTGTMQDVVRQLCRNRYVGLRLLSVLLGRNEEHLRNRVLNKMVSTQLLRRVFPRPNDPRQVYTSNQNPNEKESKTCPPTSD